MFIKKYIAIATALTVILPTAATAETQRQHDAHEHGVSQLKIALDGNKLQFEIEAPGVDIVGFEHAPEDENQKNSVQAALTLLRDPSNIFEFPKAAECTVTATESEFETEHHEEEHQDKKHTDEKHNDEEEEGHAEFHVNYSFNCASPQSLASLGIKFFDQFPNAKELEVEAVSNNGQLALEVESDEKSINLSSITAPISN